MEPVCVTFGMRSPVVVPYGGKHLDAVMSWAAVRRAEFNGESDPWEFQHEIGVARHTAGGEWCFMASLLEFDWIGPRGQLHYIKRSKLEDYVDAHMDGLLDRRPAFDGQRGATKAGSYLVPTRWAKAVKAYAVVENMETFKKSLNWVTHIGKLHHKDHGAVATVTVSNDETAFEKWSTRNLPSESPAATQHAQTVGGLRSPYWKRENHTLVMAFAGC